MSATKIPAKTLSIRSQFDRIASRVPWIWCILQGWVHTSPHLNAVKILRNNYGEMKHYLRNPTEHDIYEFSLYQRSDSSSWWKKVEQRDNESVEAAILRMIESNTKTFSVAIHSLRGDWIWIFECTASTGKKVLQSWVETQEV